MQKKMVEDMIASNQKELSEINAKIDKCAEVGIKEVDIEEGAGGALVK
jgi:hypothetical protein